MISWQQNRSVKLKIQPRKTELMNENFIHRFRSQVLAELNDNIIAFWLKYSPDPYHNGFKAQLSNDLEETPQAHHGLILNTRLLQAFSAFARFTNRQSCRELAHRAYHTLTSCFDDPEHQGGYWLVDPDNHPVDSHKKTYGQAFYIYALTEYYLLTGDQLALQKARNLFTLIEQYARDPYFDGYHEVLERDWKLSQNQQLSDKDMDTPKSMNNHLHILEAYAHLYAVWKNSHLADRLRTLIELFLSHIIDPDTYHFRLFFSNDWTSCASEISFGHDIEGSWLLYHAACQLNDQSLIETMASIAIDMARAVKEQALDRLGGLINETDSNGKLICEKHFWAQAEAVVGFLNAWQISQDNSFLDAAWQVWQYIQNYQVDRKFGEWFWKTDADGQPDLTLPKISQWKCPYHNGRACIETINRLDKALNHAFRQDNPISYEQN